MGCNKITKREDSSWFQEGFYNKYKAEETRKRYKVLLVAKGFIKHIELNALRHLYLWLN